MPGKPPPLPRPVIELHDYRPGPDGRCAEPHCGLPRHNRHHRDQDTPPPCGGACTLQTEVEQLRAQVAMLTDAVVAAAALVFGQIPTASERNYTTEQLHELAVHLVETNPRLAGAYTWEQQ